MDRAEWEERKRGMLAHEVAFVSKIFWRGANERKEENREQKGRGWIQPSEKETRGGERFKP